MLGVLAWGRVDAQATTAMVPAGDPSNAATFDEKSPIENDRIEEARDALSSGDATRALEIFDEILTARPDSRSARLGRAEALLALGELAEAQAIAGAVLETDPDDLDAAWIRARAFAAQADDVRLNSEIPSNLAIRSRYNDAERLATSILEAAPDRNEVRIFRGDVRFWLEKLDEAAEDYREALERDPDEVRLLFSLGDLHVRYLGDPDQAIPYLERVIELRPGHFAAHRSLAEAAIATGDVERGEKELVTALSLRPNDAEAYQIAWELHGKRQRFSEAFALYDRILAVAPANFTAHWHRAFLFEQQRRFDEALDACEAVLTVVPTWTDAQAFAAKIRARNQEPDEAAEAWLRLLDDDEGNQEAFDGLLALARKRGQEKRYDAALELFDELIARFPENAILRADRALTLYNSGRVEAAIQGYEDAISVDPYDSGIINDLGLVYEGIEDFPKAIEMYARAIELDQNLDAQENNAVLLFKLQDVVKAANHFERILFIDSNRERSLKYYLESRRILDRQQRAREREK